ncbi:SagB/ThcOx family dehydrogenase [Streptomyces sp. QL37]|uniref:SagB/ThcOx family dehydrogenase n=1 Tax=Streptomyces sp. QL37 TaxID=2093747 RepID=UPI001374EC79|nr:SagB/ThcOx family dehydrogenase [Streptomyces sp. QL37]
MKVRRRDHLVCSWHPDGLRMGIPGERRWIEITPDLLDLLSKAGEGTDTDELARRFPAEEHDRVRSAVGTLTELGVLVPYEDTPPPREHRDAVGGRFPAEGRGTGRPARSPARVELAEDLVGEDGSPGIFKEYRGSPVVMLPRRPLRLAAPAGPAFTTRRSHRRFSGAPVSLDQLGTLLFHSFAPYRPLQGGPSASQQDRAGSRTGGRHEVEAYVVAYDVKGVQPGLYHYSAARHALELLGTDASRERVAELTYHQEPSYEGAFTVFTTAVADRLAWKYRHPHAYRRWMHDADHYGRTFALTATALGLGPFQTVAFADSEVERFLGLDPAEEFAVYLLSAGFPERPGPPAPTGFAFPPLSEAPPAPWATPTPWPAAG